MFIGSKSADEFIAKYHLEEHLQKRAFTYVKDIKLIFLQQTLSDYERIRCLLHEIGHIKLGHIEKNGYELDNMTSETEAEIFAHEVLFHRFDYTPASFFIIGALLLLLALVTVYYRAYPERPSETEVISTEAEIKDQMITVYISPSGTHFHTEECMYADNNSIPVELKYVENNYLPCSLCQPIK